MRRPSLCAGYFIAVWVMLAICPAIHYIYGGLHPSIAIITRDNSFMFAKHDISLLVIDASRSDFLTMLLLKNANAMQIDRCTIPNRL